MPKRRATLIGFLAALFFAGACSLQPPSQDSQQALVSQAASTVRDMQRDPDFTVMPLYFERAQAIVVFPELIRGGFIFGGEGGQGVLVVRRDDGSWGYPVFIDTAGGSFGLQIGGQVSETVIAVMTEEGLDALLNRQVTFGADANVAVVNAGVGIEARTGLALNADMYAFSRNRGLFAGGTLEGAGVSLNEPAARAYYGQGASSQAVIDGQYSNPGADSLRQALSGQV
ncbi:MAG: lipid-binding SYLF domain-containing protein [Azospirillaceae bacterium]